jgi:sugar lactone lactonase YvrE
MAYRTNYPTAVSLVVALAFLTGCDRGRTDSPPAESAEVRASAPAPDSLSVPGFQTPESVLHDEVADVYLVSNINGQPVGKDDNGFISQVAPDGTVRQLKWIDGANPTVTLHAPKGLAIIADTLFVSDIDSVRAFSRTTGAPIGARGVRGATFLNDLAAGGGVLYVSDSGLKPDFTSSGTDAVYRFDGNRAVAVARGATLHGPNGLAVGPDGVIIVPFGGKGVMRAPATGPAATATQVLEMPVGQLDGVVRLADGSLLVSSWETNTVYHVDPQNQVHAILPNMQSPADIGYDARRNRVLIPLFQANRLEIRPIR